MAGTAHAEGRRSGQLAFRPSARIQRFLGRELISDPNLAIIEFVKNAYDAGAARVLVQFLLTGNEQRLLIVDDGTGMNLASFDRNWMHPGFSEKSPEAKKRQEPTGKGAAVRRMRQRKPIGEKGLGRLAAGRLGARMDIWTRPRTDEHWLHVWINWSDFDDMEKSIDEIPVPYDHEPPSVEPHEDYGQFTSGTLILISDLELKWDGKVPGRPVPGRRRTRLGRLKQDLTWLLRPLSTDEPDFTILLRSDRHLYPDDAGDITTELAKEESLYRYDFSITERNGRLVIDRVLTRTADVAERHDREKRERHRETLDLDGLRKRFRLAGNEEVAEGFACGPIRGTFHFNPTEARQRVREPDARGHGVLLYRDGVLVEPYGMDGNDWVGAEARKAQRQGYALIQPATFWGEVHVSRDENPALRDMANRQGLLENEASEQFLTHIRAEFRAFEELVTPELQERWKTKDVKAKEQAEKRLEFADAMSRALLHSLNQPLVGLAGELDTIGEIIVEEKMSAELREELRKAHELATGHLRRLENAVKRHGSWQSGAPEEVALAKLVHEAIETVQPVASRQRILVELEEIDGERIVLVPPEAVREALIELLLNAIQAPRPPGRTGRVSVRMVEADGDPAVEVADDGEGMPGVRPGTPLDEITVGTKGGPPKGLRTVHELMLVARGHVELAETGIDGVRVIVKLPELLRGLRS